jgi:anti-sigma factor RsiW
MDCQAIDIKAYCFGEASANERREAELHMKSCTDCRDELTRLQYVQAALGGLREEEPPRRIAFVSDKVFEPNWWQRFWASGPRVGFAGAGLLSTAILVHGFTRPPTVVEQRPAQTAIVARVSEQDVQNRIDSAVSKVVAQIEDRQKSNVSQLLAAFEKKYEMDQRALEILASDNYLLRKENTQHRVQSAGLVKDYQ